MNRPFIVPLDLGDIVLDKSVLYLRKDAGQKEAASIVAAYIETLDKKIVVDTGPPDAERSLRYHPYSKAEPNRPEQNMTSQLAKIGIKPEEIDIVVLTHLHWDHVGDVEKFSNAEFIVSGEELEFAFNPIPSLYVAYEALQIGMEPLFLKVIERIKTVEMKEKEICEGVRVIPTPGHTPGSISVVVDTKEGSYVIAGDAVFKYANLKGAPEQRLRYLMSGVYTDLIAMWRSYELIDEIVGHDIYRVIPGHDSEVFEKKRYP
jgi:glyoxylase-like metal-dependent hydrolase (beta-lactamase superfamily II)